MAGIADVDCLVLTGGLGTRLGSARPKPMALVGARPVLAFVLDELCRNGAQHVTLSLGHGAPEIMLWAANDRSALQFHCLNRACSQPKGTLHAVAFCKSILTSDPVLILNGDTLLRADLGSFLDEFRSTNAQASFLCNDVGDHSGVYLISRAALAAVVSLQQQYKLLEHAMAHIRANRIVSLRCVFHDVGTPERLATAPEFVKRFLEL